jgi:hypothetical protein
MIDSTEKTVLVTVTILPSAVPTAWNIALGTRVTVERRK